MKELVASSAMALGLAGMMPVEVSAQTADWSGFEAFLAEFRVEQQTPSLSVLVLDGGEVVSQSYLGWADDEGEYPTNSQTSYFIASVTKPIAGTALFLADEAGEIDLDRPLAESEDWRGFCDWFPTSPIIFSGGRMDDGVVVPDFTCQGQTLRQGLNMRVNGEPGESFLYNPLVYARVSRFIDEQYDADFQSLLYRHVLDPANMADTAAGWRDAERGHVLSHLAPPFTASEDGLAKQPLPDDDLRAAAGLYMSAAELARFDRALDAGSLISRDDRERMWSAAETYAHGWYQQTHAGERLVWHGGWEPGAYSAIYLKLPDRDLTLIALANTEALYWGNPLDRAAIETSPVVAAFLAAAGIDGDE